MSAWTWTAFFPKTYPWNSRRQSKVSIPWNCWWNQPLQTTMPCLWKSLEVNHLTKNGGSFWMMIHLSIKMVKLVNHPERKMVVPWTSRGVVDLNFQGYDFINIFLVPPFHFTAFFPRKPRFQPLRRLAGFDAVCGLFWVLVGKKGRFWGESCRSEARRTGEDATSDRKWWNDVEMIWKWYDNYI